MGWYCRDGCRDVGMEMDLEMGLISMNANMFNANARVYEGSLIRAACRS